MIVLYLLQYNFLALTYISYLILFVVIALYLILKTKEVIIISLLLT